MHIRVFKEQRAQQEHHDQIVEPQRMGDGRPVSQAGIHAQFEGDGEVQLFLDTRDGPTQSTMR